MQAVSRIDVAAGGVRNAAGMARSGQCLDIRAIKISCVVIITSPCAARMGVPVKSGKPMNTQDETLSAQADLLAEEALHELDDAPPLDALDEYTEQCDYAGCYPWLADVICAHPNDSAMHCVLHGADAAEDDSEFSC
jgi:hypothetical protein